MHRVTKGVYAPPTPRSGQAYGFEPLVMLLEAEQLARSIAEDPFPDGESEPGRAWSSVVKAMD